MAVKIRIIVIRSWLEKVEPLRTALHAAGIDATFTRVDLEPALNAAVTRGGYQLVIYDPTTPGMPHEVVDPHLRRLGAPVIVLGEVDDVAREVARVLGMLRN